ncbi:MAG: DUF3078 domain-containing protein [Bacteroidales bacterium]|nr:DUF3078 domain-containing protein [Bacteroidales bacterium]
MKKTILIPVFIVLSIQLLSGQTTEPETTLREQKADSLNGWKKGGTISVNLTQASFKNWATGGQNSIAVNGITSAYANYKKGKSTWDNMIDLGYGILHQKDMNPVKTDDKIDFASKYGYSLSKHTYAAFLFNFKTQIAKGYNYPNDSDVISDLLAPGYILTAAGIDYKPNDDLSLFIAPVTGKITVVKDQDLADAGSFGVEAAKYDTSGTLLSHAKKSFSEFGGYTRVVYKHNFFKDNSVSLLTKLDLFSNYLKNPECIDVSWETIITFKVNKYISANITTHLLYDNDIDIIDNGENIGPATQFKQVIGVGFSYSFYEQ